MRRVGRFISPARLAGFFLREAGSVVVKVTVFVTALVGIAIIITDQAQVGLPFVSGEFERRIESRIGGDVSIASVSLSVGHGDKPAGLVLRDVSVRDGDGALLFAAPIIRTGFLLLEGILGNIRPRSFAVEGAELHFRRDKTGHLSVSLGDPEARGIALFAGGAAVQRSLPNTSDIIALPMLRDLSEVSFGKVSITYRDDLAGRYWTSDDARLEVNREGGTLNGQLDANLTSARGLTTGFHAQAAQDISSGRTSLLARFNDAAPVDIADQISALDWMRLIDAKVTGNLALELAPSGALAAFTGVLNLGEGAVRPKDAAPIAFEQAKAYMRYDPENQVFALEETTLNTSFADMRASGQLLIGLTDRRVESLVTQLEISELTIHPQQHFQNPLEFERGRIVTRVELDPFRIDIGEITLLKSDTRLNASGNILPEGEGWNMALDAAASNLARDDALAMWPLTVLPGTRDWLANHVSLGVIPKLSAGLRLGGEGRRYEVDFGFTDAAANILSTMPDITNANGFARLSDGVFALTLLEGQVQPQLGPAIDLAGSTYSIADVSQSPAQGNVVLRGTGEIPAFLSLVDEEPLRLISKIERTPDMASGRAEVVAAINFPQTYELTADMIEADVQAQLFGVTSQTIVPGHPLDADRLLLNATMSNMEISGLGRISGVPADFEFDAGYGEEQDAGTHVSATFPMNAANLAVFGALLPAGSTSGTTTGRIEVDLSEGAELAFRLTANLAPVVLRVASLDWSKPAGRTGDVEVTGKLGQPADISSLRLNAPGLSARGDLDLGPNGLVEARFSRLIAERWLDAPVVYRPGPRNTATVTIGDGTGVLDLRHRTITNDGEDGYALTLNVDRMIVSDSMLLRKVTGNLNTTVAGLKGRFNGFVNGGTRIEGVLQPGQNIFLQANDGGKALADAGLYLQARGGILRVSLEPGTADGLWKGQATLTDTRVSDAPALAELLSVASVVGIVDQMAGPGIGFSEAKADFNLAPDHVLITSSHAIAPSMGITMNGVYYPTRNQLDMEGVVSPFYFVNGIFEKIPILGRILGGRNGEGLLGMNYTVTGTVEDPKIGVNPLSILTPGAFREIFQRRPEDLGLSRAQN